MTKAKTVSNIEATNDQPAIVIALTDLYKNTKQITIATNNAVKLGNNLQAEYQRIACSVIQHIAEHKDIRVVRHLLDTMPEGMRKKSMSTFFDKYAPVTFTEDADTGKAVVVYDAAKPAKLAESLTFAWWKASVETAYTPFNFVAELQKQLVKAENKLKKGASEEKGDAVSTDQVEALRALIVSLSPAPLAQAA